MVLLGLVIVIATFALIIKNYEVRLVLAISGALMALIGGDIVFALNEFVKTMTAAVVPTICAVLGFSYVMSYTKCSDHLVVALTNLLRHVPIIIVPATVVVTWLLSIACRYCSSGRRFVDPDVVGFGCATRNGSFCGVLGHLG